MTLEDVKRTCEERRLKAEQLYKEYASDAIFSDINNFIKQTSHRVEPWNNGNVILDGSVCLSIIDGNLHIEDRRGTAFLWIFELDCNIFYTDTLNSAPYCVRYVTEDDRIPEIQEVIASLEASIEKLERHATIPYTYYCDKPQCNAVDIEEVLRLVYRRKPVIC